MICIQLRYICVCMLLLSGWLRGQNTETIIALYVYLCNEWVGVCIQLHWITVKYIKRLCKEHGLYQTPELNDVLYLHYKVEGVLIKTNGSIVIGYATIVWTVVNHLHTLSCGSLTAQTAFFFYTGGTPQYKRKKGSGQ